jgi:hypothetical protein
MDKINEQPEYVAPTIVDYGDIFEITAAISQYGYADVPQNSGPYGPNDPQDQPSLPVG